MAGRPPKPTNLKVLQGTDRPDRANDQEPKPPVVSADEKPPTWLKGRGRREWKRLRPMLRDLNLLTVADTDALALLCDVLAEYIQAREVTREHGQTYSTYSENGTMWRQRPEVAIAADAWRRAKQMMTEFGMTPSSRSKVRAGDQAETDPFEEFVNRGSRSTG